MTAVPCTWRRRAGRHTAAALSSPQTQRTNEDVKVAFAPGERGATTVRPGLEKAGTLSNGWRGPHEQLKDANWMAQTTPSLKRTLVITPPGRSYGAEVWWPGLAQSPPPTHTHNVSKRFVSYGILLLSEYLGLTCHCV
jgi:hypothetical protein